MDSLKIYRRKEWVVERFNDTTAVVLYPNHKYEKIKMRIDIKREIRKKIIILGVSLEGTNNSANSSGSTIGRITK